MVLSAKQLEKLKKIAAQPHFHLVKMDPNVAYVQENFPGHTRKGQRGRWGEQVEKLTKEDVELIRRLYHSGVATQMQLADLFEVSQANISYIVRRRTWKGFDGRLRRVEIPA